jgi:hypothetical protein
MLVTRAGQAVTRRREDTGTGRACRQTVYAVTTLTSAHAATQDLARLVREQWSTEADHHIRDVTFGEDTSASRTGQDRPQICCVVYGPSGFAVISRMCTYRSRP